MIASVAMLFMVSCKGIVNTFMNEKVLASVDDKELYFSEVEKIFTPGLTPADSIKTLEAYVDAWVKKQLKVIEAEQLLNSQQQEIDQMVDDYRNSLLNFKLDQYYVDNKLDTAFTEQAVNDYYQKNRADFVLDRAIVKGMIVKFPDSYRQKAKLKELMRSGNSNDRQDFIDICMKNVFELTEFNNWVDFNEFLAPLPTIKSRKYDNMSTERSVQEMADADNKYYIIVTDSRSAGDQAPIERVREVIERILFNQRKEEIIRSYEDSIYRGAIDNNRIVININ